MVMIEMGPPLVGEVRNQLRKNRIRGDKKSNNGEKWDTYGATISHYEKSFGPLLKEPLRELLKDRSSLVVIDLMGPSTAISSLFNSFPDKPKFGLAVSLEDLRSKNQIIADQNLNVEQISGDILKSSTWNRIANKMSGRKADLIVERALGGLSCIPEEPRLYAMFLSKIWNLLSKNNGLLLAGIPVAIEEEVVEMVDCFRSSRIDIFIDTSNRFYNYIKVIKTPNSPERLPFPSLE